MSFISAKTILTSINILDQDDIKSKKIRHPKNEFQAFAYKLSKDFNDDKNLKIYMMLAKNVERSLMERAYSFAIDSTSDQKGRLFLWKLKQLRTDMQKQRNKTNFTYEFISKQMSKFRNELAEQTIQKSTSWQSKELFNEIENFILQLKSRKPQLLSIGINPEEIFLLQDLLPKLKIASIEISSKVAKLLKEKKRKEKIIGKDFYKNSYSVESFDLIMINSYWQFIPLDSELKFLSEVKKVMHKSGRIIINHKESLEDSQEWKGLVVRDIEKEYFIKYETNHTFRTVIDKCELEIEHEFMSGPYIVYILKSINKSYF